MPDFKLIYNKSLPYCLWDLSYFYKINEIISIDLGKNWNVLDI